MILTKRNLDDALAFFLGDESVLDGMGTAKEFFLSYVSDNNSSTLREAVTLHYLGYRQFESKHGADGIDDKTGRLKEVKPRYLSGPKKIGNSGNFNDMTMPLLEKKKNQDIICSLFYENRLVYIIEFPMTVIYDKISIPILNAKVGRRVVCHFSYKDYMNGDMVVHYLSDDYRLLNKCLSTPHKNILEIKYDNFKRHLK